MGGCHQPTRLTPRADVHIVELLNTEVILMAMANLPSIRDDIAALRTSIDWIKWTGGAIGATVMVAAVKYIVFTPWG